MTMKIGELFAGYGGLGLAVEEVFDAELGWYAEFDAAPSKIMAHHYPDLTNYGDVTTMDWATVPPVDIISGGSPCQDLSLAGARKGMNDGTRSNLWESMREAIATIKPTYVVWENVRGALSATATSVSDMGPREGLLESRGGHLRALGRVLGDLADLGYDTQWRGLRAADVGAPHGRFRVFLLATRRDAPANPAGIGGDKTLEHDGSATPPINRASVPHQPGRDTLRIGPKRGHDGRTRGPNGRFTPLTANTGRHEPQRRGERGDLGGKAATGKSREEERQRVRDATGNSGTATANWGPYTPAIRRWEAVRGAAPAPIELTAKGKHRLSARFAEWLMGVDTGWITDVPGITRNDQLKAAGNGVVPAQAAAALTHMLKQGNAREARL